jgi:hypothetical protein
MSDKETQSEIDAEIRRLIEVLDNQNYNDQIESVRKLVEKYVHLTTTDHMMDGFDLKKIINNAKSIFAKENTKIYLGKKKTPISQSDMSNYCVIEATIRYLNTIGCLKKLPKFDKRDEE